MVGQRFAGRGARRDDHVATSVGEVGGGRLMRPWMFDATCNQCRAEIRRHPRRPVRRRADPGRHSLDVGEALTWYRKRNFYKLDAAIFLAQKVDAEPELLPPRKLASRRPVARSVSRSRPTFVSIAAHAASDWA